MEMNLDERDKIVLPLCIIGGILVGVALWKYNKGDEKSSLVLSASLGGLLGALVGANI